MLNQKIISIINSCKTDIQLNNCLNFCNFYGNNSDREAIRYLVDVKRKMI